MSNIMQENTIHSSLCNDNITTFTEEELNLNQVYRDVRFNNNEPDERTKQLESLRSSLGSTSRSKLKEHPSKNFLLSGGLKRVLKKDQ
jgi:hypothetical protein